MKKVGVVGAATVAVLLSLFVTSSPSRAMMPLSTLEIGSDLMLAQAPRCRPGTVLRWKCVKTRTSRSGRRYCQKRQRACVPKG